jgi:hypothetical protein
MSSVIVFMKVRIRPTDIDGGAAAPKAARTNAAALE